MGKGDKKTRRGKIFNGSFGVRRPGRSAKPVYASGTAKKVPVRKSK